MKKFILSIIVLAMIGLTTNSCQNDDGASSQKLTKNSTLTSLLLRVTHNSNVTGKGGNDDNESCFSVNLPVTIMNNGQIVTVTNQDDYAIVQSALHQCDDDNVSVSFVFPISITSADGTTQIINSEHDLKNVLDACSGEDEEEDEDDDVDNIECFNIHYPISITYTDANNLITVITLNNDDEAYHFLSDLEATGSMVISYPISITDATGETVVVNNNNELQSAIEEADSECGDHDEDNEDHDEDNEDHDEDDEDHDEDDEDHDHDGNGKISNH